MSLEIVLGLLGLIGFSTLSSWVVTTRRFTLAERYLRFTRKEPLDIVLVTSDLDEGGVEGAKYKRPVTSTPTVQAAVSFAVKLGLVRKRKPFEVCVSERLKLSSSGDLVMLGDPVKNKVAAYFLECFNRSHPHLTIARGRASIGSDGESVFALRIGQDAVATCRFPSPGAPSRLPETDIGLIVNWINPFSRRKRRAVLCAGWTAFGTAAAADYFVNHLLTDRYAELRRDRKLPRLYSAQWPCFVCAVQVTLIEGEVLTVQEIFFRAASDAMPTAPLRPHVQLVDVRRPIPPQAGDPDRTHGGLPRENEDAQEVLPDDSRSGEVHAAHTSAG